MKHSESLASVAAALALVHAELQPIAKDKINTFFKNKYATLDTIIETVRPILAKHGLSIVQGASTPHTDTDGTLTALSVDTMLLHKSGEWIMASIVLPVGTVPIKDDNKKVIGEAPTAQTAGSTVTYGRRYGISALLSLSTDEDDDGNKASERHAPRPTQSRSAAPARVIAAIDRLPNWPTPYAFAGVMLKDAPKEELLRIINWEPKDVEKYAPLKEAIVLELERRRTDSDFSTASPALQAPKDDLPF